LAARLEEDEGRRGSTVGERGGGAVGRWAGEWGGGLGGLGWKRKKGNPFEIDF
jgi:hypothetical protein